QLSHELAELASNGSAVTELEARSDAFAREIQRPCRVSTAAIVQRVKDVSAESVSWLWPARIARGKLTLLVGEPGVGKSFVTLDVASRISRGAAWPDRGPAPGAADVVLLSAEDGVADTIRPRLDTLEADVARVHVLTAVRDGRFERSFLLTRDLPVLEQVVSDCGAALVVVDP